jgi:hypothetical protein
VISDMPRKRKKDENQKLSGVLRVKEMLLESPQPRPGRVEKQISRRVRMLTGLHYCCNCKENREVEEVCRVCQHYRCVECLGQQTHEDSKRTSSLETME